MVWQAGKADFTEFFTLFVPSLVNWLIPATIMSFTISNEKTNSQVGTLKLPKGKYYYPAIPRYHCTCRIHAQFSTPTPVLV